MSVINFNIAQWRAWAPGLESVSDWQAWSRQPVVLPDSDAAPDVSFLPAMQRRRLSRLARMAFSVGWPLAEGRQDLPLVFVSRHGETPRTVDILSDLAAEQLQEARLRGEPGERGLHPLLVDHAPAVGQLLLLRPGAHVGDLLLDGAGAGQRHPLVVELAGDELPAAVLLEDEVLDRHAHVVVVGRWCSRRRWCAPSCS